ncbi:malonic semialdehyde reductase [Lichenicola sp.]|uniref:malonic semialdehyde reductase n=1 Tax=Lichenicola sp. TaxID=2804529 RepID=UPI003B0061A8
MSSATPEFGPPPVDAIDAAALDRLFRTARTPSAWSPAPVAEETIRALYDLVKLGPTSGNCSPGRFVFLTTRDSRERLRPALSAGNVERTMSAAVTVIVAQDPMFFDNLPRLYPAEEARSWFAADHGLAEETAFRNATLQGGYLILAARALGLDAWPMSGFDSLKVDEIFLAGSGWRSNFLVNLGYADGAPATPRGPRLTFDEACMLL